MNRTLFKLIFFTFIISGLIFYSCKQEIIPPIDVGYTYFPSNQNHWLQYEVDSTYYDDFTHTVNSSHFKLKEIIESYYIDNQNRETQRIERYKKANDTAKWLLKDIWAANITSSTAEKVEENFRYIKLIFPIAESKKWNGNALNCLGSSEYEYDNVFKPYSINGITFDSTVTVIQKIDSNMLNASIQFEVYAKNVGLIYKRYRKVNKFPSSSNDSITSGIDYTYKIISFGN